MSGCRAPSLTLDRTAVKTVENVLAKKGARGKFAEELDYITGKLVHSLFLGECVLGDLANGRNDEEQAFLDPASESPEVIKGHSLPEAAEWEQRVGVVFDIPRTQRTAGLRTPLEDRGIEPWSPLPASPVTLSPEQLSCFEHHQDTTANLEERTTVADNSDEASSDKSGYEHEPPEHYHSFVTLT